MTATAQTLTQGRPALLGSRFMVSTSHYLATQAGQQMIARGGNAIDAGVAAGIAINVVECDCSDFGGVAPIILWRPGMAAPESIDGLGRWPRGFTREDYIAKYGRTMPAGVPRTVTPGAADAWLTALARHGTLPLAEILAPAIELAAGFPMYASLAQSISSQEPQLRRWPTSAAIFLPGGRPPQAGEIFVQRDLKAFFERLAEIERAHASSGRAAAIMAVRDDIYEGEIAQEIDAFMREIDAALTAEDLREYHVTIETPVHTTYRGYDVYASGPWSQGPVVPMTLNILEGYDVAAMGAGTVEHYHRYAEAAKLAFADREGFFGDPGLVRVPIDGLLDKDYAAARRALIDDARAYPELPPPGDPWSYEGAEGPAGYAPRPKSGPSSPDTSYVCAIDAEGNVFSATPSDPTLSSPVVPGLGIQMSSRGSQFWLEPEHPSAMAPGKRPRLTPNPALLMRDGRPVMAFGCPGGDAQTQAMIQTVLNVVDFGMNAQAAIEFPRVISASFPDSFFPHNYEPGLLFVEAPVDPEVRDGLAALGHIVLELPDLVTKTQTATVSIDDYEVRAPHTSGTAGVMCAVRVVGDALEAGADPRGESYAAGW